MPNIRLIALDLDGTVFNDRKEITPRTVAAIQAAIARGVAVVPATGRTVSGLPQQFLSIPGVRYLLVSNGACVVDRETGQKLVYQPFDVATALPLFEALDPLGGVQSIFIDGECYTTPESIARCEGTVPDNLLNYFRNDRIVVQDMHKTLLEHAHEVEKFSIIYATEAEQQAAWQVAAAFAAEPTSSLPRNLELNAPGVTKGSGLLALADALGLQRDEVMAVGDSGNDLAMIRAAGLGIAMGNATGEVKQAADAITLDNEHDGVAVAIERYVLEGADL